jgi:hypothetical protein
MRTTHGADKSKCPLGQRAQRGFSSTGDHHIGPAFPDISEAFADRDIPAGTAVGVSGTDTTQLKLDCNLQCADPPKTCNASVWCTDLDPPLTKALCCTSAFETPPSAVPKLTPTRSCGLSAEYSNPLSRRASLTEATANWAYRSNRFNRCGGKYSSGFQSSTSAALVALKIEGSNLRRPYRRRSHKILAAYQFSPVPS